MAHTSSEALPLVSDSSLHFEREKDYDCCHDARLTARLRRKNSILITIVVLQAIAIAAIIFATSGYSRPVGGLGNFPFSPARHLLWDEVKVFSDGLKNITVYQGNGTQAEQAWEDLYLGTTMRLTREEALQIPNRTLPINNDDGYYIAELDVFHELHCLNSIRRAFNGEKHQGFTMEHLSHCFDSIRQHIMCNIDVSVIVWRWNSEQQAANPAFTHPHKCSNFEEVRRWARSKQMLPGWDKHAFVADNLPEPTIIL